MCVELLNKWLIKSLLQLIQVSQKDSIWLTNVADSLYTPPFFPLPHIWAT